MKLGEVANKSAVNKGMPLSGVKILALEQLQSLPFATQLLARLGAEVVKVERPGGGESGRQSLPAMTDPDGRRVGATFLRNNLNKKSIVIDLKLPKGRDLVLQLAPHFDVVAENFRPGVLESLRLGYSDIERVAPRAIYLSVSGFGGSLPSPYRDWPAYATLAEAMSGIYEMNRVEGHPPVPSPMGGVGDISAALFATIGVLAALRHREQTGHGQYVDISMMDAMVSMTDLVSNFWSMGVVTDGKPRQVAHMLKASDGWFALLVIREYELERLANVVGRKDWLDDPRLATRAGWAEHFGAVVGPGIEEWVGTRTRMEVCSELTAAGVAASPCLRPGEVVSDPHVKIRDMMVEMERTDGVEQPILIPGNPVRMSDMAIGPETRIPWVGEHTDQLLSEYLDLKQKELAELRAEGVVH